MAWLSAGTRLQVKYDDGKLYPGTVSKWNADKNRATINFDDGTVEDVLLGAPGAKAQEGLATHGTDWKFVRGGKKAAAAKPRRAGAASTKTRTARASQAPCWPPRSRSVNGKARTTPMCTVRT